MAVLKDYKCPKHGYFEARKAKCPMKDCNEEVMVVFLKAPGLKSEKTKRNDQNAKNLAKDFGMTDIKTTKEGENQVGAFSHGQQREARPGDSVMWGNQSGMNMNQLLKGGMFRSVAGEQVGINPKDAGNLTGPRTASYTADHENLTLKK